MATRTCAHLLDLSLEKALKKDSNLLNRLREEREVNEFKNSLASQPSVLESLVAFHLGLAASTCKATDAAEWLTGEFNVVIPVTIGLDTRVVIRCPMPAKLGESRNPGSIKEKMAGEVASYVWMQEKCPDIRIPHLYGFGFPCGRRFTHSSHLSFLSRLFLTIRRTISAFLRQPLPSFYTDVKPHHSLPSGYMILEYLGSDVGNPPSTQDISINTRRENLFRSLSRIILKMSRYPQPRIGSYRFQDDGTITLTNRPLTSEMMILENDGSPQTMARDKTYTCTDAYITDLIKFHEESFWSDPSAITSEDECWEQMVTMLFLSAKAPLFYSQCRYGPFISQLTDLHMGNLLVDGDGNISALVDLEWTISRPVDMLTPPIWIFGKGLREIAADERQDICKIIYHRFMDIFEEEERLIGVSSLRNALGSTLSSIMRNTFDTGRFWFNYSLNSVNGMYFLPCRRLFPLFGFSADPETFQWCPGANGRVKEKLNQRAMYEAKVAACLKRLH